VHAPAVPADDDDNAAWQAMHSWESLGVCLEARTSTSVPRSHSDLGQLGESAYTEVQEYEIGNGHAHFDLQMADALLHRLTVALF
jgi:hypothetical protein